MSYKQRWPFSCSIPVIDKTEGCEEASWVGSKCAASMWIHSKVVMYYGKRNMQGSSSSNLDPSWKLGVRWCRGRVSIWTHHVVSRRWSSGNSSKRLCKSNRGPVGSVLVLDANQHQSVIRVKHSLRHDEEWIEKRTGRTWSILDIELNAKCHQGHAFSAAHRDMSWDALWVEIVGHVLHDVIECCANRRIQCGAVSRGGSFERLGASQDFCEEWKMRRVCALSNTDLNPVAKGTDTSAQLFGIDRVSTMVLFPRRWQRTVIKSFVKSTEGVSAATSPCCSIEITCHRVNMLTNDNGLDCEDQFLRNTPFLAKILIICIDRTEKVFWPLSGGRRKDAREHFHHLIRHVSPRVKKRKWIEHRYWSRRCPFLQRIAHPP